MLINILLNEFYLKKSKKEKWGGTHNCCFWVKL